MPSYDYNAILQTIQSLRSQAYGDPTPSPAFPSLFFSFDEEDNKDDSDQQQHPKIQSIEALSQAVEEYDKFITFCPMTPFLWLQYAYDAGNVILELLLTGTPAAEESDDKMEEESDSSAHEAKLQASQVRRDILESATNEFPGCDLLWVNYLQMLLDIYYNPAAKQQPEQYEEYATNIHSAFDRALYWVGRGTHSYSHRVGTIWRMYAYFAYHEQMKGKEDSATKLNNAQRALAEIFSQRSRIPLQANDTLLQEAQHWSPGFNAKPVDVTNVQVNGYSTLHDAIDTGKQYSSKVFQKRYESYELSIQSQLYSDGLLQPSIQEGAHTQQEERLYMGYGGYNLASIFINFAKTLGRKNALKRKGKHGDTEGEGDEVEDTSIQMYERGISVCPTVDHIWIAYIHSVSRHRSQKQLSKGPNVDVNAMSLVNRAVRNCPYSLKLFYLKMHLVATSSTSDGSTTHGFNSDSIVSIAKEACDGGFLQDVEQYLSVWLEACRVVRRALMSAVQGKLRYDEYDAPSTKENGDNKKQSEGGDDVKAQDDKMHDDELPYQDSEEIQYLIEDLRDAFETADEYFRQNYAEWNGGRAKLWRERANVECNVVLPIVLQDGELLSKSLHMASSTVALSNVNRKRGTNDGMLEAERCFENVFRLQPIYTDAWSEYIPFVMNNDIIKQREAFSGMRKIRALFHRVIRNASLADPPASLEAVCGYLVSFEEMYGSSESLSKANGLVQAKILKMQQHNKDMKTSFTPNANVHELQDVIEQHHAATDFSGKRKFSDVDHVEGEVKRLKVLGVDYVADERMQNESSSTTTKPANLKVPKEPKETIRIGNLSYPVHPFTVKVSNLSPKTEDMDLVDSFSTCGKIVHARILREKTQQHHVHQDPRKLKSKGIGLVQFEERESVSRALELNDTIGLHEHLIQVERSHIPAVSSLVPPGMNRINRKGDRQSSKKDQVVEANKTSDKSKEKDETMAKESHVNKSESKKDTKSGTSTSSSILSFRPRGVSRQGAKKKVQLDPVTGGS